MLNFYSISIDPNIEDETGVYYNALVDVPAHMKAMAISFSKKSVVYHFNEEKRIVTGVMISAGTPIYRNDSEHGEHYVVFDAKTISQIRDKFHKQNFNHNVNIQHNMSQTRDGVYMNESYTVGVENSPGIPEAFKGQNLQPGTWIASYKIENNSVWAEVKAGKYMGFSVEGLFYKDPLKIKKTVTNKKQMKNKKTIFERLFQKSNTDSFAKATTTDGVELMYDGELAEGTAVFIEVEGGDPIPAPEGDHQVTLEDGTSKVITIDAAGLITAVADSEPDDEGLRGEVEEVLKAVLKDTHARFEKLEKARTDDKKTIEALEAKVKALEEAKPSKFGTQPQMVEGQKLTAAEILAGFKKKK